MIRLIDLHKIVGIGIVWTLLGTASSTKADESFVFASLLKNQQIITFLRDDQTGTLHHAADNACPAEPAFLTSSADGRYLFASLRSSGQLASFRIAPSTGRLSLISVVPGGLDPAFLAVDHTGRFLLTAYYISNQITVHTIAPDGKLGSKAIQTVPTTANAHGIAIDKDNRHIYVAHTGGNRIDQFYFDANHGLLTPMEIAFIDAESQQHPRHIVMHPSNRWAYCSNEAGSSTLDGVSMLQRDNRTGHLRFAQRLSSLPKEFDANKNSTSRCLLTPDGNFLFVANRGHNSLASYRVDSTSGSLSLLSITPTETTPRSFTISNDGRHLYVAGEANGVLSSFAIGDDGKLTPIASYFAGPVAWALHAVDQSPATSATRWHSVATWNAEEAVQAAAIDNDFVYAITNTKIAKYDRNSGEKISVSHGDAKHLNSGYLWENRLVSAHSNYPSTPEHSEVKVLDPKSMELTTLHDFGNYGGSLTWIVRKGNEWWCHFARYGSDNHQSFLVQFDTQWKEIRRWTYPTELVAKWGNYSASGGIWRGEVLHITGHDAQEIYRLRLPTRGTVLQWIDTEAAPFTGQGFATDPTNLSRLVGIDRKERTVILAERIHPSSSRRLNREKLLEFESADDKRLPVKSLAEWNYRRQSIVEGFTKIVGKLPGIEKHCNLDIQVEEDIDCGVYRRQLISYAAEPNCRVPAYLCIPKHLLEPASPIQQSPAVLCLHSTDDQVGHGVIVGLSGRPNRNYASELAERGYVTLSPSYPLLANYQPDLASLGWESGTIKAVWDNMRGIDLLQSLPYVQRDAIGAIGHSLGGHNSIYTALLDARIRTVVSSCGLDSFLDYYDGNEQVWLPERGWTQTRYMPRLADYRGRLNEIPFDFHELIGALAPRSVLIIAPLHDSNFRAASVDRIQASAAPVYELYDSNENLRVIHPDCEHDFPNSARDEAYRWLDATLRPESPKQ